MKKKKWSFRKFCTDALIKVESETIKTECNCNAKFPQPHTSYTDDTVQQFLIKVLSLSGEKYVWLSDAYTGKNNTKF